MSKMSRAKGSRVERHILHLFNELGFTGKRVGFLPALGIPTQGDLEIEGLHVEVKARKNGEGFAVIQRWLVLVANNKEPLVVQTLSQWSHNRTRQEKETNNDHGPIWDNPSNRI